MGVKLPNRATKLDPLWSEPHTEVETPSEHTATLDEGTPWNNEKLWVESAEASPGKQLQQPGAGEPQVGTPRRFERGRSQQARYADCW